MNVTLHTLSGLAAAAVLSSKQQVGTSPQLFQPADRALLASGFTVGVIMHGLLDFVPHNYPINSAIDVVFSLALFFVMCFIVRRQSWLLLGACFLGSIFPDLVDLGPALMNARLGWSLPVVKLFPWHWPQYSGSIYDGSRESESLLYHVVVAGVSIFLLYSFRDWYRAQQDIGITDANA